MGTAAPLYTCRRIDKSLGQALRTRPAVSDAGSTWLFMAVVEHTERRVVGYVVTDYILVPNSELRGSTDGLYCLYGPVLAYAEAVGCK